MTVAVVSRQPADRTILPAGLTCRCAAMEHVLSDSEIISEIFISE